MNQKLLLLFCRKTLKIVIILFATSLSAANLTPSNELEKILKNHRNFSGNFTQTTLGRFTKTQTGWLGLSQPNKINLRIDSPQKALIIADGKYLWHTRFALEQTVKRSLNDNNPAFNLLAQANPRKNLKKFKITKPAVQNCLDNLMLPFTNNIQSDVCFVLKPAINLSKNNSAESGFQSLLLYFKSCTTANKNHNLCLKAVSIQMAMGGTTIIVFKEQLNYSKLNKNLFKFTPNPDFNLILTTPK